MIMGRSMRLPISLDEAYHQPRRGFPTALMRLLGSLGASPRSPSPAPYMSHNPHNAPRRFLRIIHNTPPKYILQYNTKSRHKIFYYRIHYKPQYTQGNIKKSHLISTLLNLKTYSFEHDACVFRSWCKNQLCIRLLLACRYFFIWLGGGGNHISWCGF